MKIRVFWRLIKESFKEYNKDKVSRLAAALSYYTIFSLAPLLIIAIAIAGFFFGEEAAKGEIVFQLQGLLGKDGAEVIQMAIENAAKPNNNGLFASLVSIAILLFGASGVFTELQDALNTVWEVKPKSNLGFTQLIRKRFLSFAMVLVIGFLLLVSLLISALLTGISNYTISLLPGNDLIWQIINNIFSFTVIALLFAMIFKFLPDVKITWGDVSVGAIITALLFVLGKSLIGLYLGNNSFSSTYGAAGSIIIVLVWTYYSAQILFFGAEFTQVYARKYGSQILPDKNAVKLPNSRDYS
ncbi:YihY/virulence factor BrkB family protein [Calothrix sp. UHCC 0171]|uniref:YihY/virulence factor BrkB family protein n=1 Tax=Calothrix sp. UHCC 0171 TaxID=3110245 RepID=UPI002B1EBDE3|nr:YihY/virulence factor BrkB family protein [Calothrix sp. UHCC 0171]MEA5574275.1 YihY/virulence factor BrkB family protein [Calothrix sp. UHCC 0171]